MINKNCFEDTNLWLALIISLLLRQGYYLGMLSQQAVWRGRLILFGFCLFSFITVDAWQRVIVPGSTGYIGRQVVQELVRRNIPTVALVRSLDIPAKTLQYLNGAEIVPCNFSNLLDVEDVYRTFSPTATICCLASRSGVKRDSWLVDYQASLHTLRGQESVPHFTSGNHNKPHFVLLSAFCCGKPLLQFQFAKLKLEEAIKATQTVSHSIIRPTAFFKSLDGQVESISKGYPALYFGDGSCAANPISERDLASFLVDCATQPQAIDMLNTCRDIGGPDVPPITKLQQIELISDMLNVPKTKRLKVSLPVSVLDFIINFSSFSHQFFSMLSVEELQEKFEDAAEIARIVKYYATEPMVAIGANQVQGQTRLVDHFQGIAARGGMLDEVDKMTTTTGVLELFTKNEYVK